MKKTNFVKCYETPAVLRVSVAVENGFAASVNWNDGTHGDWSVGSDNWDEEFA